MNDEALRNFPGDALNKTGDAVRYVVRTYRLDGTLDGVALVVTDKRPA